MDDGLPVMAFRRPVRECPPRSQARAVEFLHLELLDVDAVQAAHVEHHHVPAAGALAVSVGLDATRFAEWMMNRALVELVVGHPVRFSGRTNISYGVNCLGKDIAPDHPENPDLATSLATSSTFRGSLKGYNELNEMKTTAARPHSTRKPGCDTGYRRGLLIVTAMHADGTF